MAAILEHNAEVERHHLVHFYEDDADLIARAGPHVLGAVETGALALVIATEAHRGAFEQQLRSAGVDVAGARDSGALVLVDASELLGRFMRDDGVDREAFLEAVGGIVRDAAGSGRPVCAYGEMVDLLWRAGDVIAAIEVETLWNELADQMPFSLYCAYHGESVSGHEHADALRQVCELHSEVVRAIDPTWRFPADGAAPGRARRLATEALRRAGHSGELLEDARLIITELATNAVEHARSPFSVSVHSETSTVRIDVRDESLALPEMREYAPRTASGRGLRLVATLATRWGVDLVPDGKVVWAELGSYP